jgi:hypothetical protein
MIELAVFVFGLIVGIVLFGVISVASINFYKEETK